MLVCALSNSPVSQLLESNANLNLCFVGLDFLSFYCPVIKCAIVQVWFPISVESRCTQEKRLLCSSIQ